MNQEHDREERIIACYREMAKTSDEMLRFAQSGDWDAVIAGEKRCAILVAELKQLGNLVPEDEELRAKKRELIRAVLANDAAIRDLAEPRIHALEMKLRTPKNARKLALAYGAALRPY
ncbi:MAG: flagellar protein FliT [Burkholderiaceae bacterium]|jgi:flagellar protein FliT